MFTRIICLASVCLSASVVACGSAPDAGGATDESAVSSSSDAAHVKGAWTLSNDTTSIRAIVLNSDRTFFRANALILNGVIVNGGSGVNFKRETGTWSISASKHTLTFQTDRGSETFTYKYSPAPILNGVFLPGHEPKAKLELTGIPAPGSHIAFATQVYQASGSFCLDVSDCNSEKADKIWSPTALGAASCNSSTNACEMHQSSFGGGNSNCEVEEGGTCVSSASACTSQGGLVSGNDCIGSTTGTVCCNL